MRDNKGFSLIELVVVVALMAVVTGFLAYSFSLVTGQESKQCANNLSTALDRAKNYALTRSGSSDAYMELLKEPGGGYIVQFYVPAKAWQKNAATGTADYVMQDSQEVGKSAVQITCLFQDGTIFSISESSHLRIYYDRISGAFKKAVWVDGGTETEGSCRSITIERGKKFELTLIEATGKHSLERVD